MSHQKEAPRADPGHWKNLCVPLDRLEELAREREIQILLTK